MAWISRLTEWGRSWCCRAGRPRFSSREGGRNLSSGDAARGCGNHRHAFLIPIVNGDRMPRVAAGAAMAADHRFVARQLLFDGYVIRNAALRAGMSDAGVLRVLGHRTWQR